MKRDSGRHAERGDAKQTPSEGCQSGPEASPERYRDTPTEAMIEAGVKAWMDVEDYDGHAHEVVAAIYTAMQAARSETPVRDELKGLVELLIERVIEIANSIPPPDDKAAELMMAATTARSFLHRILAKHYRSPVQDDDALRDALEYLRARITGGLGVGEPQLKIIDAALEVGKQSLDR